MSETQNIQTAELNLAMDEFHEWFEREKAKGLVDVKFFLGNTSSNSATVEKAIFEGFATTPDHSACPGLPREPTLSALWGGKIDAVTADCRDLQAQLRHRSG